MSDLTSHTSSLRERALAAHRDEMARQQAEEQDRAATAALCEAKDQQERSRWTAEAMGALFGIEAVPADQERQYPIRYADLLFENPKGAAVWDARQRCYLQSAPWESVAVRIPCAECGRRGVDSVESAHTVAAIGYLLARHQQRLADEGPRAALCDHCQIEADEREEQQARTAKESLAVDAAPIDPAPDFTVTVAAGMLQIAEGVWRQERAIVGIDDLAHLSSAGNDHPGRGYRTRVWVAGDECERLSPASVVELLYALDQARMAYAQGGN